MCACLSFSLVNRLLSVYTCAFPNELSNLPKARTLARGSHLNARMRALELTRSNEASAKVKQTYIASGTPRAEVTLVMRYYAYYPAGSAIERKCLMYERDAQHMEVDLSDEKKKKKKKYSIRKQANG